MATLACVDLWFNKRDHEAEFRQWNQYAQIIIEKVRTVPSVRTVLEPFDAFRVSPLLMIDWSESALKITPDEVSTELFRGDPRIRMITAASGVEFFPYSAQAQESGKEPAGMMTRPYVSQEGEAEIVANRLHQVLLSHLV